MTSPARILRELIALPSVNPAFLPKGDPHAGEARVAEYLAHLARKAGCEVAFQTVLPGRSNVLIRVGPAGGGKVRDRVLLAPHLDTVGGNELPGRLFKPVEKNGRLHGRGACDTKGSVAAMFSALLDMAGSRTRPKSTEILFAGLVDEESTQAGSRALAGGGFQARLAVVGEPTRLEVVTAHKGDLWLRLETRGKAAHGARPELGRNAIHEMARVVAVLETEYARAIGRKRHRLLGRATINVGQIQGGRQPNIVPDRCVIRVDRRTLPGERDAGVKREIVAFLKQRDLRVWMDDTKGVPSLPLDTDPGQAWVKALMKAARQASPRGVDYFSDAGVLAAGGIPSVLFGPGDIAQAHTEDEWVRVSQLDRARAVLGRFLGDLA
jgi:acetylornithine deacetylase/succinyl-diaminopimelate desuccinylase-like protein